MTPINRRGFVTAAAAVAVSPESAAALGQTAGVSDQSAMNANELDFSDDADFKAADKGFIAALEPGVVKNAAGDVVWDNDAYDFLDGDAPKTANASLWRQSQLVRKQGLYKVADRIYQVRGLDLSNMTIVEGDTGIVVIDPLISAETAAAALELYRDNISADKQVTGLIYTHPHVDHYGGCRGVLPDGAGDVPILAPEGFMEHAVSENVFAGTAMTRRSIYMYGAHLDKGPTAQLGCGLGQNISTGTVGLLEPTKYVSETGQRETVDGVVMEFQMTPGTEAPAEMNFLFPELRAVCMAENATHTMHNIVTLRGAQVRDAKQWAAYLTESVGLYDGQVDVAFASHHWPTWGNDEIVALLEAQRDLYAYMHDQTLRMLNSGMTGKEIAEEFQLPPALAEVWANRGYYGSVSHNVKGIYQRYMGWFDANPAHLWEHPPVAEAKRYVKALGGMSSAVGKAREFLREGDLRFAATLLNHCVFADPDHQQSKQLLAQVYEKLAYATENAVWRNFYLTGARELREGVKQATSASDSSDVKAALSVDQLIDAMSVRVDGPKAWDLDLAIDWYLPGQATYWHLRLKHGVLTRTSGSAPNASAGLTLIMSKVQLLQLLAGKGLGSIQASGDVTLLTRLFSVIVTPTADFNVVTP
ncbi:alkyl/aryl-sulfatase [Streptomyces fulvoviolaceus]|uniref:alkyl/aryl-sulfatase n=1 Tax=Streptomyces fulvoviolaceus TaxID=285535 RepID=UPI0021BF5550|nr:alkyl sulfatase dimerization domain-containing protein [Streptomyces fulvoviolaceus]MCT9082347.1 MBL fold metallo-hydrolase [Streptomyces fulvoviolaceus]